MEPNKEDNNINNNIDNNIDNEKKILTDRIKILLHPKPPSIGDSVFEGTKNGFLCGVGVGLMVPIIFRGRGIEPVSSLIKSVLNLTFIGTTFSSTLHILQYNFLLPPMSSWAISGLIIGGTTSHMLGRSNFAKGMFSGGIFGALGYMVHNKIYREEINRNIILDINELKGLVEENKNKGHNIELSLRDQNLYDKLMEGVDNRMSDPAYNQTNDSLSFSKILKSLNPLKEITEEEKKLIIQKNNERDNTVILDLKGKSKPEQQQNNDTDNNI
ncbi:hypothetical protein RB653_000682 [Dictyostelium firmibasis]|uniref:Uncharacterized protein n=1 Tax=Dictyostelium firmibasis TaxID=79012 RepID=A0AAN7TVJ3_9MYCE